MKIVQLVGVSALLSMAVACAAEPAPSDGSQGRQTSPVTGQGGEQPGPSAPDAGPSPAPAPACTALPKPIGVVNPAGAYCGALGYAADGNKCAFPDGTSCEQWAFYRGECGQSHSFCNLHGGTVANKIEDMGTWTASYAVCSFPDGKHCQEDAFAHSCSCE